MNREKALKEKYNDIMKCLTSIEKDYYKSLCGKELFAIKSLISNINNIITLRLTLNSAKYLNKIFKLSKNETSKLFSDIYSQNINANGYDILFSGNKINIIAEVKCNVHINDGNKFGVAQREGIMKDIESLFNGKSKFKGKTTGYYKFLFIYDNGHNTDEAIKDLLRNRKYRDPDNNEKSRRNEIRKKVILIDDKFDHNSLTKKNIYLKKVLINKKI